MRSLGIDQIGRRKSLHDLVFFSIDNHFSSELKIYLSAPFIVSQRDECYPRSRRPQFRSPTKWQELVAVREYRSCQSSTSCSNLASVPCDSDYEAAEELGYSENQINWWRILLDRRTTVSKWWFVVGLLTARRKRRIEVISSRSTARLALYRSITKPIPMSRRGECPLKRWFTTSCYQRLAWVSQ